MTLAEDFATVRATLQAKVGKQGQSLRALDAIEQRVQELEAAVRWALGERGEFRVRASHEGAFYWRTELRERAFGRAAAVLAEGRITSTHFGEILTDD